MKIIVGLGNPGKKYEKTRHNMGYEVLDSLAEKLSLDIDKKSFDGVFARFSTQKEDVILFKPTTYMNLSGIAVQEIMQFYKVGTDDIIVIFDDMSLPPGSVRLRLSGTSGGQKGIQNIIDTLGTTSIKRIKVGIGEPEYSGVDYVLSKPTPEEKPLIDAAILRARDAVIYALEYGFEKAMSMINVRKEKESDSTE
jgi:PTH1 family peptidyl-tRNA hydrolase